MEKLLTMAYCFAVPRPFQTPRNALPQDAGFVLFLQSSRKLPAAQNVFSKMTKANLRDKAYEKEYEGYFSKLYLEIQ